MNSENKKYQKDKIWRARMHWSSRRGMLEMDYFLQAFLEQNQKLSDSEKKDYERLLLIDDNQIYAWLTCQSTPTDKSLNSIINKIRKSAKRANKTKNQT